MTFQEWVNGLIQRRFGTATALASAIGMQLSPFTRGVAAGTLNLVNLLKLARVAEEAPAVVLKLAGKAAEAELLESLYGGPGRDTLTPAQREFIETWEHIPDEVREHFAVLLKYARDVADAAERKAAAPRPHERHRRVAGR